MTSQLSQMTLLSRINLITSLTGLTQLIDAGEHGGHLYFGPQKASKMIDGALQLPAPKKVSPPKNNWISLPKKFGNI